MYRSNSSLDSNAPMDNMSAFHGLSGLNMYLDANTLNISPPGTSSTLSPPATPLSPEPAMSTSTQFPLLSDNSVNINVSTAASNLLLQRQYQYYLLLQEQQQQLALAQHQLALAASAAAANHHQKDEIAHSLKMFALLTACNADSNNATPQDVMQEFANNGFACDELSHFQCNNQGAATPQAAHLPRQYIQSTGAGIANAAAAAATNVVTPSALTTTQWINVNNYRERLNNVWRSMYMSNMPHVAVNPCLAMPTASQKNLNPISLPVPPEHMRSSSNANIANNKLNKRFNSGKPKDQVVRHCVFCENNNEPEALVQSHSVRDTFGRVLCPKLRTYVCPICGASGDSAHTIKYCPKKPIVTMEDAIKAESFRLAKGNYYKQQMKV